MKIYRFTNDSYYDDCGCSCCDSTLMEAYNCDDVDYTLGTAHSEEECFQHSIITSLGGYHRMPDEFLDELRAMSYAEIKQLADDLCIIVEIGD